MRWAGVVFGTTNSAVAFVDDAGVPVLAQFPGTHGPQPTFRGDVVAAGSLFRAVRLVRF